MQVDEQGREIPGIAKRFPTHAEALAYADRKARTREVVLPRVDFTIQAAVIDLFDEKGKLTHYAIDNADHIKLIATYLLAHAERMEELSSEQSSARA